MVREDGGVVVRIHGLACPSADAFDQPNVTGPSLIVNQPCPRTRFATEREPIVTDRRTRFQEFENSLTGVLDNARSAERAP